MTKTKITPRAKEPSNRRPLNVSIPAPRHICPVCKEFIGKEDFEKHLIECYKGRPQCSVCGPSNLGPI